MTVRQAEVLVLDLDQAEGRGDSAFVNARMASIEEAIAFLMDLNHRLAGRDPANAPVASLQYQARLIRQRSHEGPGT
jgi:hypothetical protein